MASRRLLRAASTGDVDAVDALIREGADPGFQVRVPPTKRPVTMSTPAPSNTSHNPLIIPTAAHPRLLLPTAQDRKGTTPLMLACEHGHVDVVRSLLAAGAPW